MNTRMLVTSIFVLVATASAQDDGAAMLKKLSDLGKAKATALYVDSARPTDGEIVKLIYNSFTGTVYRATKGDDAVYAAIVPVGHISVLTVKKEVASPSEVVPYEVPGISHKYTFRDYVSSDKECLFKDGYFDSDHRDRDKDGDAEVVTTEMCDASFTVLFVFQKTYEKKEGTRMLYRDEYFMFKARYDRSKMCLSDFVPVMTTTRYETKNPDGSDKVTYTGGPTGLSIASLCKFMYGPKDSIPGIYAPTVGPSGVAPNNATTGEPGGGAQVIAPPPRPQPRPVVTTQPTVTPTVTKPPVIVRTLPPLPDSAKDTTRFFKPTKKAIVDHGEYWEFSGDMLFFKLSDLFEFFFAFFGLIDKPTPEYVVINTWPKRIVPYTLQGFSKEYQALVEQCIKLIENMCGVDYRKATKDDKNVYVVTKVFGKDYGGCSTVGYSEKNSCEIDEVTARVIVHEFMHGLGLMHEQQRPDRDSTVDVLVSNIDQKFKYNFVKVPVRYQVGDKLISFDSLSYDCQSIMHYSPDAFSKNDNPTIVGHDNECTLLMGSPVASAEDRHKLKVLYGKPRFLLSLW